MRVADRQRGYARSLGRLLALLCVVGTWSFAAAPPSLLREHWDTTLAWVTVIACCGVAAEAFWNLRDHRRTVGTALTWPVLVVWALVLSAPGRSRCRGSRTWCW
jgi:hypothetical protein